MNRWRPLADRASITIRLNIWYYIQSKVWGQTRMCDVSSPIQHCHRLGYEENNEGPAGRIRWTLFSSFEDIAFVDDVALLSHTRQELQEKASKLKESARN